MELNDQWELEGKALRPVADRYKRDNSRLLRLVMGAGGSLYEALVDEFEDSDGSTYAPEPAPLETTISPFSSTSPSVNLRMVVCEWLPRPPELNDGACEYNTQILHMRI